MNQTAKRVMNGVARKIIPGAAETLEAYNALRRFAETKDPHKLDFALSALQNAARKFRAHAMDESTKWREILSKENNSDLVDVGGDDA